VSQDKNWALLSQRYLLRGRISPIELCTPLRRGIQLGRNHRYSVGTIDIGSESSISRRRNSCLARNGTGWKCKSIRFGYHGIIPCRQRTVASHVQIGRWRNSRAPTPRPPRVRLPRHPCDSRPTRTRSGPRVSDPFEFSISPTVARQLSLERLINNCKEFVCVSQKIVDDTTWVQLFSQHGFQAASAKVNG